MNKTEEEQNTENIRVVKLFLRDHTRETEERIAEYVANQIARLGSSKELIVALIQIPLSTVHEKGFLDRDL